MPAQEIEEKLQPALAFQFWSAIIRHLGLVAQSVEQRIENPCVGGSIPPRATKNILDETPIHADRRFALGSS